MPKSFAKIRRPVQIAACLVGVVLIVVATLLLRSKDPAPDGITQAITHTEDNPAETPIDPSYSVPDNQPLSIAIGTVGLKGFVQKVGIDQNKDLAAPNNVHLAGWFADSVVPGRQGLSIIDGHVSGLSQGGVFHALKKVKAGDTVVVTFGDKTTKEFVVFDTKSVDAAKAAQYLFDQAPGVTSQLNLITCTGKYVASQRTYDQRYIVFSKLVQAQL